MKSKYKIKSSAVVTTEKRKVTFADDSYAYDHGDGWMYEGRMLCEHPDRLIINQKLEDWFHRENF